MTSAPLASAGRLQEFGVRSTLRRLVDFHVALGALVILSGVLIVLAVLVKITSKGPILYWSNRIGIRNVQFRMPKFRTMRTDAPVLATHLIANPRSYLTPIGGLLRMFSLDELPQLFSILRGDMTLIGPRPALYNQDDLIALRTEKGIHHMVPGLTGWAQINGRDGLTIREKVALDEYYLFNRSVMLDLRIVFRTCLAVVRRDGVQH